MLVSGGLLASKKVLGAINCRLRHLLKTSQRPILSKVTMSSEAGTSLGEKKSKIKKSNVYTRTGDKGTFA